MNRSEATAAVFHPERLLAVLGRFKVEYVLTGSLAARLHGSPLLTAVSDIVPAVTPRNFEALAGALRHLAARAYTPAVPSGVAFDVTADTLASAEHWDLLTTCGRARVWFRPRGTGGYAELIHTAARFALHGDEILVASIVDLLRIYEAPGGDESAQAAVLRELLVHAPSPGAGLPEAPTTQGGTAP